MDDALCAFFLHEATLMDPIITRPIYLYKQLRLWQSRHYLMVSPWHQFKFRLSVQHKNEWSDFK